MNTIEEWIVPKYNEITVEITIPFEKLDKILEETNKYSNINKEYESLQSRLDKIDKMNKNNKCSCDITTLMRTGCTCGGS